jgi:hypothetical protein
MALSKHLVLLRRASVAEVGGVAAVGVPGRGAELVKTIVTAGVHDLGVAALLLDAGKEPRREMISLVA